MPFYPPIQSPNINLSAGTTSNLLTAVTFSNSNGVSFGLNAGTMTGSVAAAAPSPMNFSAGTTSSDIGSVVFSNSGGVSFGLNGSTITATVVTTYQPAGAYLTTAMLSNRGSDFVQATAAFAGTSASGTIASGGISVSIGPYITTGMLSNAVTLSNIKISAGTLSALRSAVTFGDSNGVSFGLETNGSLTATVKTDYQTAGAYLTTAALSNHSHGNPTLNLTNLSGTTASASNGFTLSLSAAAGGGAAATFSAGTSSASLLSLVFSNSNGVSFGLNGSTMTASAAAGAGGGATLVQFEPFPLLNAETATWAPVLGSWYFQPFVLPQNMAAGRINYLVSNSNSNAGVLRLSNGASFASNTTGTRSCHHVMADTWALYTRGTGTNYTRLESLWSNTRALSITQSISIAASAVPRVSAWHTVSYIGSIGTNGAVTMTTMTHSGSSLATAASLATSAFVAGMSNLFNLLTGQIIANVGITLSLSPGNYWLAAANSTSQTTLGTSVGNIFPFVNELGIVQHTALAVYRGWPNTVSITSSQHMPGQGVFSAASNAAPATVAFNAIRSVANNQIQYFNMLQSDL